MGSDSELELLFHEAAAMSGELRANFVEKACHQRPELRQKLERLLVANDAGTLLEPLDALDRELRPGSKIGRYRLIEKLGEGGCGLVFMAEQVEPIRRRVALKVIKAGMDSRSIIARFEAERQALALMDHPNIARVFDAGTTEHNRPFFVMELVRGRRITDHCDHFKMGTRERLGLFAQVCQAIQHAHQKGIIHRDLKPSNILVSVDDGVSVPKVIDFGVAKAMAQPLTEKTLVTGFHQLLGTPAYMSPEQADFSNVDVDTRSDIYSLGVLLYELLTGSRPFEAGVLFKKGIDEVLRTIREDEPPRPSTRVSLLPPEEQTTLASKRGIDLPELRRELSGDLDWIVMKCVEKDRTRRYQTAVSLSQDCQRFLNSEPVQARPPSAAYRLQKFARRHRAWAVSAAVVCAAIVLGLATAGWQWRRAILNRDLAERQSYATSISHAEQLLSSGDTVEARRVLFALPEGLRGWEWGRLMAQAHQEVGTIPLKKREVEGAETSSDYSMSNDGSLFAWWRDSVATIVQVKDGKVLGNFGDATNPVWEARLSPDGQRLLLVGTKMGWELWQVTGWVKLFSNDAQGFTAADFRADGNQFVTCGGTNAAVWDTATGKLLTRLPLRHSVSQIRFSLGNGRLYSSYRWEQPGQTQFIWDASSGAVIAEVPPNPFKYVRLSIADSGERFATADRNDVAAFWKVGEEKPLFETPRQGKDAETISRVEASSYYPRLAAICKPGQLHIWDIETGIELRPIDGLAYEMWPTPDRKWIVTSSHAFQLRVWDWRDGAEQYRLSGGHAILGTRAYMPPSSRFIAATSDGQVNPGIAQIFALSPPDTRISHSSQAFRVSLSPDGNRAAMAHMFRSVSLWDANTGETLAYLDGHFRWVCEVLWSPDGKRLYSGSADKTVRIWDAERCTELKRLTNASFAISGLALSPDEHWLAALDTSGCAHLWSLPAASLVRSWQIYTTQPSDPRGPLFLSFDPGSQRLAISGEHGQSGVWEVESGKRLVRFPSGDDHAGMPIGMGWSPDGAEFAFCDLGGLVQIWDATSWKRLRTIQGRGAGIQVMYSPEGDRLFVTSSEAGHSTMGDTSVNIYDPRNGQFIFRMGKRQGNSLSLRPSKDGMRIARCVWANAVNAFGAEIWDAVPWHDRDYPARANEPVEERVASLARERIWKKEARYFERRDLGLPSSRWHPPRNEWPTRAKDAPAGCIDLTEQYNGHLDISFVLTGNWERQEDYLGDLPRGIVRLDGVDWDIRGVLALAHTEHPHLGYYWPTPHGILGIAVNRKCRRLHFLHGALDLWTEQPSIGRYRLHYADGTSHDLLLQPGIDIGHWWTKGEMCKATAGRKVWEGSNVVTEREHCHTALFHRAWDNPFPEKEIITIDFLSDQREPVPFLVALTVE